MKRLMISRLMRRKMFRMKIFLSNRLIMKIHLLRLMNKEKKMLPPKKKEDKMLKSQVCYKMMEQTKLNKRQITDSNNSIEFAPNFY